MRFKLDENLPAELPVDLRSAGHEADSVTEEGLAGAPDSTIMAHVQAQARTLLTMDKGVADGRTYPPSRYAGIVLFRPRSSGRGMVLAFVRRHLPAILEIDLAGHLLVASESGIRVR